MTDIAIRVENLSKRYRIGSRRKAYRTMREALAGIVKAPGKLLRFNRPIPEDEIFWALNDISFELRQGEVLGVIGRNGAGKSTLLKILSRITEPTKGQAEVHGRVGSLLEVGTGFHPELTGRENIYLNGAILGMRRVEINRHFDEIVAFAGSENFIDTPVKHYSSGMYLRLAFAVAAHLEPEILIVDEVLAVGDAEFQKKCLGKLSDVSREGRTVLFVSHNMAAINILCKQGIVLNQGQITFEGPVQDAVAFYLQGSTQVQAFVDLTNVERKGRGKARLQSIRMVTDNFEGGFPRTGDDISFVLKVHTNTDIRNTMLGIYIHDHHGVRIIDAASTMLNKTISLQAGTDSEWHFTLYNVLLRPGRYRVAISLTTEHAEIHDWIEDAMTLEVLLDSRTGYGLRDYPGLYRCHFSFSGGELPAPDADANTADDIDTKRIKDRGERIV